ncbi:MAG: thiamine diphosphokinase [Porphyromonadaceae bacterium]|nr:thiamine diphosphokinase [Porphyromonadaceae bacterium]
MLHYSKPSLATLPQTIVLANGDFPRSSLALELIEAWVRGIEDLNLICCDGAVNKLGLYTSKLPDAVVGDLDSIAPKLKAQLTGRVYHYPDQDTNDLTKTMNHVAKCFGARRVTLLGASGGREDHLLGNLALLPSYAHLLDELIMLTDSGYFRLIREPSCVEVEVGQQVSVFSFAHAPISLHGVYWPLEEQSLPALWAGTLNRAISSIIELSSPAPLLLFVANSP